MTAIILYSPLDVTSHATFRTSCGNVDATFVATGWVRSSDSGQIADWGGVGLPGIANTSAGYSIYHMNDALQATYPVFIKIEYGTSASSTIGFWVTLGTGSNGSGTLTGILNTRLQFGTGGNNTLTTHPSYISGSSSRYSFVLCANAPSNTCLCILSIERTKDSTGTLTSDGVMLFTLGTTSTTTSQYLPFSGTIPAQYSAWNCNIPASNSTTSTPAYKNTVALYPIRCWTPGESGPSSNIFIYQTTDITPSPVALATPNTVSLSLFDGNVTSTYVPILNYNSAWAVTSGSNRGSLANIGIAMRYE